MTEQNKDDQNSLENTPMEISNELVAPVFQLLAGSSINGLTQYAEKDEDEEDEKSLNSLSQWINIEDKKYVACQQTIPHLPAGMYSICEDQHHGILFEKVDIKTHGLLKLKGTASNEAVNEIMSFWEKEERYRKHGIIYKRGLLLYGPAGTGKTSTIQLIVQDVVERGGVCFVFTDPYSFKKGMRRFRSIQKTTPVVVIMEDMDSIIQDYSETDVLNILDGLENIDKVVFLATTNYPEKLGQRITNRPSRFDKRWEIGYPTSPDRKNYLTSLNVENKLSEEELDKWVKDTKDYTFAHLKELYVSVVILENNYKESVRNLNNMKKNPSKENKKSVGFSVEDEE